MAVDVSVPERAAVKARGALALKAELPALLVLLLLAFVAYAHKLGGVYVPHMDEGTYLYAAKLVGEGEVPYRDFYLAHPPLMMYAFALPMQLSGDDVMFSRYLYMAVVLLSCIPLYLLTRGIAGSGAAFLAVALYGVGMVLLANSPRSVRLEPFLNVFVICALWVNFARPDDPRGKLLTGALAAAAVLVKLVAAIPLALLVLGDLLFRRPRFGLFLRGWSLAALGSLPVLALVAVALGGVSGFIDDVIVAQVDRPGLPLQLRIDNFRSACLRFPAIPFAVLASIWLIVRSPDWRLRTLALLILGQVVLLIFAFKSSFNYYYLQILPEVAVVTAVVGAAVAGRLQPRFGKQALAVAGALMLLVLPLAYSFAYQRQEEHTKAAGAAIAELKQQDGAVYSMFPSFALWSERELTSWHFAIDSLLPRSNGEIPDDDFIAVLARSRGLVLWNGEFRDRPAVDAYIRANFRPGTDNNYWEIWLR
jgi:hypothetical protein